MTAKAQSSPIFHASDAVGAPLSGGKVFTFEAGTTTLKAVYTDPGATVPHTNPVILNARGEAIIFWATGLYKVRVEDASGVLVYEVDPFDPQVAVAPEPAVNLVVNGSFEADADLDGSPDGWTLTPVAGGSITRDAYDAANNPTPEGVHGAAALKFIHPGGIGNGSSTAQTSAPFRVTDGLAYDVAFSLKASVANIRVVVDVLWVAVDGATVLSTTNVYDDQATNPTAWGVRRGRVVAPAGARFAHVRLIGGHDASSVGGTVWMDAVCVVGSLVLPDGQGIGSAAGATFGTTADGGTWQVKRSAAGLTLLELRSETGALLAKVDQNGNFWANSSQDLVLTSANMGSGNLLNADMVDGIHAVAVAAPNALLALDAGSKLPASITGTASDAPTVGGQTPASLRDRTTHTGIQAPATISPQGAGSGLDADTLDGVEGAAYLRADIPETMINTLNHQATVTFANAVKLAGRMTDGVARQLVEMGADDITHIGTSFAPTRIHHNGNLTEQSGNVVWHAGNDGPGSGLDADTLDGVEGAGYAPVVHTTLAADLTTPGHVELATVAETQTGTDATRAATPAGVAGVALGMGQTWQDMTGSRAGNTVYTNNTGRSIQLMLSIATPSAASWDFLVGVGTPSLVIAHTLGGGASADITTASPIIPPGYSYKVAFSGNTNINLWAELR